MMSQEENGVMLTEFLEKGDSLVLVIYVNQQGQLTPINDFPATSKNKVAIDSYEKRQRPLRSRILLLMRMRTFAISLWWVWLLCAHARVLYPDVDSEDTSNYYYDCTLQAVYFVKRRPESIKKDNFHDLVMFGDLSHVPLDHFSALIDTVSSFS